MICFMSLRSCGKQTLRQDQAVARVGVVGAHLHPSQFLDPQFFGGIVKQHAAQRVARILRPDQVRQRQRDFLRWREAIFAIEDHAVAAIQHQHRRAGALILTLVDVQVLVFEVER